MASALSGRKTYATDVFVRLQCFTCLGRTSHGGCPRWRHLFAVLLLQLRHHLKMANESINYKGICLFPFMFIVNVEAAN